MNARATMFGCFAFAAIAGAAAAEENYESWEELRNPFPSTGGGEVMIGEYRPVVTGNKCLTNFTATTPDGTVYRNVIAFDAVATQGGVLCHNGMWAALDGSAAGTTPFRVFIKDGIVRRSP
jgi:hypothetical protein